MANFLLKRGKLAHILSSRNQIIKPQLKINSRLKPRKNYSGLLGLLFSALVGKIIFDVLSF
jgi:hypothetical protein